MSLLMFQFMRAKGHGKEYFLSFEWSQMRFATFFLKIFLDVIYRHSNNILYKYRQNIDLSKFLLITFLRKDEMPWSVAIKLSS